MLEGVECALESNGYIDVDGEVQLYDVGIMKVRFYHSDLNDYFGFHMQRSPLGLEICSGTAHDGVGPAQCAKLRESYARNQFIQKHVETATAGLSFWDTVAIALQQVVVPEEVRTDGLRFGLEQIDKAIQEFPDKYFNAFCVGDDSTAAAACTCLRQLALIKNCAIELYTSTALKAGPASVKMCIGKIMSCRADTITEAELSDVDAAAASILQALSTYHPDQVQVGENALVRVIECIYIYTYQ